MASFLHYYTTGTKELKIILEVCGLIKFKKFILGRPHALSMSQLAIGRGVRVILPYENLSGVERQAQES